MIQWSNIENGAEFIFEEATLQLDFLSSDAARVCWTPGIPPAPHAFAHPNPPTPSVHITEGPEGYELSAESLTVRVRGDGSLQFTDADGRVLRQDLPPTRTGDGWQAASHLLEAEIISGLGERAAGLDLRGGTYRFWNRDPGGSYGPGDDPLYVAPPIYLSLRPAASSLIFYENSHNGRLHLHDQAVVSFDRGQHRYVVIAGPPARALTRLAELLDPPSLPPAWALSYHQARWGYGTQGQVEDVLEGFERHDLPLGALHLDIDYMEDFRVFTVAQDRFPDLAALSQRLQSEHGARLVCILDPGIHADPDWPLCAEGHRRGVYCQLPDGRPLIGVVWPGNVLFPDFSDSAVRRWWGQHYRSLLEQGVSGFWHDMNEPTSFAAWGDPTFPLTTRHHLDGEPGDHRSAHNLYAAFMNQAGYEALHEAVPDRRPWILSRSGWLGLARHAWTWTGDIESTWEALQLTIPTLIGLGLSGIPFAGPDVGGFSGAPSAELYLRWFQLAAFLPFFRTHSSKTSPAREPWQFGTRNLDICRETLRRRERLLPYLYTLAAEAHQYGWPLVRPLFWHHPTRRDLWAIEDAFLLGDHLLVAPALEPHQRSRGVRLPPGAWWNYWTEKMVEGPTTVQAATPLAHPALFVQAGAVLPTDVDGQPELQIYPPQGATVRSARYRDAGDGYGPSSWDRFLSEPTAEGYQLRWRAEGEFPLQPKRVRLWLHGPPPQEVSVDGRRLSPPEDREVQTGAFHELHVQVR